MYKMGNPGARHELAIMSAGQRLALPSWSTLDWQEVQLDAGHPAARLLSGRWNTQLWNADPALPSTTGGLTYISWEQSITNYSQVFRLILQPETVNSASN